ncbi:hypothetical protein Scep_022141 [Stephania cephalantha]|uniref:Uncharacterized protein n=1 Tax=Stephania cephalantha TaxID=152367 RepID=A0AAP0I0R6_9MAGN
MSQFLSYVKANVDSLSITGSPMSSVDVNSCVFAGLEKDYLPITVVQQKVDLSWTEQHATLVSFEATLQHVNNLTSSMASVIVSPSANVAFTSSYNGNRSTPNHYGHHLGRGNYIP